MNRVNEDIPEFIGQIIDLFEDKVSELEGFLPDEPYFTGDNYDDVSGSLEKLLQNWGVLNKPSGQDSAEEDKDYAALDLAAEIEKLKRQYKVLGMELLLDENDFIDNRHLDCIWYGEGIGAVKDLKTGMTAHVGVFGEVRLFGAGDDFSYIEKSNTGAFKSSDSSFRERFDCDAAFHLCNKPEKLCWGNNNWVECCFEDEEGEYITEDVLDSDNVFEAFTDPEYFKDRFEDLAGDKAENISQTVRPKFAEVRNDYMCTEPDNGDDTLAYITIDTWETDDDSEEGKVAAVVSITRLKEIVVTYILNYARGNEEVCQAIEDAKKFLRKAFGYPI